MDLENAEIRLNEARRQWEKAIEKILVLTPGDGLQAMRDAYTEARAAWRGIDSAMQGLINVKLRTTEG